MTLQEAIAVLMGHANRDEVVGLLEKDGAPLAQAIFQKGHNVGYAKKHGELNDLTAKLDTATAALTDRDKLIADLRAKAPDAATLTTQFQTEIKTLQDKHKTETGTLTERLLAVSRAAHLKELRASLVAAGVDKDYAQVLTEKSDVASRVVVAGDGTVTVLQPGLSVPYAASTPEDGVKALAADLLKGVEPRWLTSRVDRGAGATSAPGVGTGAGPGSAGEPDMYAQIRKNTREALDAKKKDTEAAKQALATLGVNLTP